MIKSKDSHYLKFINRGQDIFNLQELKSICNMSFNEFKSYGETVNTPYGEYIYKDNHSKILAIAHLDTVRQERHFHNLLLGDNQEYIFSPALDDRLGVYIILKYLPLLGINPDVLLTDNEEIAFSTAEYFHSNKSYNWLFSFDRAGKDLAMYDYKNSKFIKLFKRYKINVVSGSYSDIASLYHLKRIGFNFGVGYHDNHSLFSYAKKDDILSMIGKFIQFYDDYKNKKFIYNYKVMRFSGSPALYSYSPSNKIETRRPGEPLSGSLSKIEPEYIGLCSYCDTPIYNLKSLYRSPDNEIICNYCASYYQTENKCLNCGVAITENRDYLSIDSGLCDDCLDTLKDTNSRFIF